MTNEVSGVIILSGVVINKASVVFRLSGFMTHWQGGVTILSSGVIN
jgi:hypothetical protein